MDTKSYDQLAWCALMGAAAACFGALTHCSATSARTDWADAGAESGARRYDAGVAAKDASTAKEDAEPSACDANDPDCVACDKATCTAPSVCCGAQADERECAATCPTDKSMAVSASCDGPEDCPSGDCCVDVTAKYDGGVSGVSACNTSCTKSNSSTGYSIITKSIACRSKTDCAGVTGSFGVPYPDCCHAPGFDVGVCVSQTYSSDYKSHVPGATCN